MNRLVAKKKSVAWRDVRKPPAGYSKEKRIGLSVKSNRNLKKEITKTSPIKKKRKTLNQVVC